MIYEDDCGCDQNLTEDDQIHRSESIPEYKTRLLRTIQSGDISSMDHHDRVHGALAYIDHIRDQYEGSARNIHLVVAAQGNKRGKIGYKVHGIGGSGKELITTPLAMGASHGSTVETPIKHVYGLQVSSYPNLKREHIEVLRRLMDFRGLREMFESLKQIITEAKNKNKKPYKGFVKGKNHPEGGLSRKEAHRQGIHAGIETKDEAKRKGGFNKLSKKTQSRRKSFCARMCGMKRRRTSSKTAHDPKSKINAALRVWGCRCGTNESYETETPMLNEKRSLKSACWKGYEAIGTKMKNGRKVPNCVPISERVMSRAEKIKENHLHKKMKGAKASFEKQYPGRGEDVFYATTKKMAMQEAFARARQIIKEEVVNSKHKGTMTEKEKAKRDRIAKTLKNVKPIKGKPDSEKEAKYRYATYLVLRERGGKSGSEKEKKNTKKSKAKKKKNKK